MPQPKVSAPLQLLVRDFMNTLQKLNLFFGLIFVSALFYLQFVGHIPVLDFHYLVIAGCIWLSAIAVYLLERRLIWIAYSALLLFTIAPILSAFLADLIAAIFGANLYRERVPCLMGSYDLGPLLYTMSGYGWLMLLTLPVGIILILALTISLVVARRLDSKRKAQLAATVESAEKHEI
jgi:hypothetical protein